MTCATAWLGTASAQNSARALQPRGQNVVPYVSAGVGEEEQQRMRELAQQGYTLKLVFAETGTGAYVADVRVLVADASGRTVLDAVADGPQIGAARRARQTCILAQCLLDGLGSCGRR